MPANKVIKSVSFNTNKHADALILKAIKRRKNFSGYVKKLILADIEGKTQKETKHEDKEITYELKPLSTSERLEVMKKELKKPGNHPGNVFRPQ